MEVLNDIYRRPESWVCRLIHSAKTRSSSLFYEEKSNLNVKTYNTMVNTEKDQEHEGGFTRIPSVEINS